MRRVVHNLELEIHNRIFPSDEEEEEQDKEEEEDMMHAKALATAVRTHSRGGRKSYL